MRCRHGSSGRSLRSHRWRRCSRSRSPARAAPAQLPRARGRRRRRRRAHRPRRLRPARLHRGGSRAREPQAPLRRRAGRHGAGDPRAASMLERPFLDISDRISSGGERGLLSIAFDPDYAKNRRLYVYFTDPEGDIQRLADAPRAEEPGARQARVAAQGDRDPAPRATATTTAARSPSAPTATSTSRPATAAAPATRPRTRRTPTRCSASCCGSTRASAAATRSRTATPSSTGPGADEIYSLGLRNPFRFSFDPKTKTIAIGDVGQGARGDRLSRRCAGAKGANFGWDALEGSEPLVRPPAAPARRRRHARPAGRRAADLRVRHSGGGFTGCAITGGLIVRDRRLPTLYGRLPLLRRLQRRASAASSRRPAAATGDVALGPRVGADVVRRRVASGRVYVTSLSGDVFRIDPTSAAPSAAAGAADEPASARVGDGRRLPRRHGRQLRPARPT